MTDSTTTNGSQNNDNKGISLPPPPPSSLSPPSFTEYTFPTRLLQDTAPSVNHKHNNNNNNNNNSSSSSVMGESSSSSSSSSSGLAPMNPRTNRPHQYVVLVACGSFNPITNLHLRMFENSKDHLERECGYTVVGGFLSPVHDKYGKESLKVNGYHRYAMCQLATRTSDWIATDSWEVLQPEYSRTRIVLTHFKDEMEKHYNAKNQIVPRILLLCGADLLESFVKQGVWRPQDVDYILETFGTACVERDIGASVPNLIFDHDVLYKNRKNIHSVPAYVTNNVSSTRIRTLMERGYSVKYYLDDQVIDYIKQYGVFDYLQPQEQK